MPIGVAIPSTLAMEKLSQTLWSAAAMVNDYRVRYLSSDVRQEFLLVYTVHDVRLPADEHLSLR